MIEAVMLWNEPNNLSHWNFELDAGWNIYAKMVNSAADAVRAENSSVRRVLGGISPIDPDFLRNMQQHEVLNHVDVVAVHGFPLDHSMWSAQIDYFASRMRVIAPDLRGCGGSSVTGGCFPMTSSSSGTRLTIN